MRSFICAPAGNRPHEAGSMAAGIAHPSNARQRTTRSELSSSESKKPKRSGRWQLRSGKRREPSPMRAIAMCCAQSQCWSESGANWRRVGCAAGRFGGAAQRSAAQREREWEFCQRIGLTSNAACLPTFISLSLSPSVLFSLTPWRIATAHSPARATRPFRNRLAPSHTYSNPQTRWPMAHSTPHPWATT